MGSLRISLCALLLAAWASVALPAQAEACVAYGTGPMEFELNDDDFEAPWIVRVEPDYLVDTGACSPCGYDELFFHLDMVDADTPVDNWVGDLGVRLELVEGSWPHEPLAVPLTGEVTSDRDDPDSHRYHLSVPIYGHSESRTVWRITPIDRAGNEGKAVLVSVPGTSESFGCSTRQSSGAFGLLLVLLALLPCRRRRSRGK